MRSRHQGGGADPEKIQEIEHLISKQRRLIKVHNPDELEKQEAKTLADILSDGWG